MAIPGDLMTAWGVEKGRSSLHCGPLAWVCHTVLHHHPAHVARTALVHVTDEEPPHDIGSVPTNTGRSTLTETEVKRIREQPPRRE